MERYISHDLSSTEKNCTVFKIRVKCITLERNDPLVTFKQYTWTFNLNSSLIKDLDRERIRLGLSSFLSLSFLYRCHGRWLPGPRGERSKGRSACPAIIEHVTLVSMVRRVKYKTH